MMVIVVVAVVLLLAAKAWQRMAPEAIDVTRPETAVSGHGPPEAVNALGELPNLGQMRQNTSEHAAELQKALEETE